MKFNFIVKSKEGEVQSGVVEAATEKEAIEALQAKGLIILSLKAGEIQPVFARQIKLFQRVKNKDLVTFARQFATLASAQVPLLQALKALEKQTANPYFKEILKDVSSEVESGTLLSKAFANHPKVFSHFF